MVPARAWTLHVLLASYWRRPSEARCTNIFYAANVQAIFEGSHSPSRPYSMGRSSDPHFLHHTTTPLLDARVVRLFRMNDDDSSDSNGARTSIRRSLFPILSTLHRVLAVDVSAFGTGWKLFFVGVFRTIL